MSRVDATSRRYRTSASLVRAGVEVVAVGDPAGARLNAAAWRLLMVVREDGPGLWDDLVGVVKALRWRLVTQPQPTEFNPAIREGSEQVAHEVRRLRGAVSNDSLLDELSEAAIAVGQSDSPLGAMLVQSIEEVGSADCVVVAASMTAAANLGGWLSESGVRVLTAGGLLRELPQVTLAYVVGPPRFFKSQLVTAPVTNEISFLMPAWFGDRSIPHSSLAAYADGAIRIEARVFTEGDVSEPGEFAVAQSEEDELLPQPIWGNRLSVGREPASDEVEARKVLLSGASAVWLDDGDRIRTLDPTQPPGERVTYAEVDAVRPGTYLLLRQGETERGAMHAAALDLLGPRGPAVEATQLAWKELLSTRLGHHGYAAVVRDLVGRGVSAAERARAWTDPNLIRPSKDRDFEALLQWLDLPIQPTFGHATELRRMHHQASSDVREALELAVGGADPTALEWVGHLSLDMEAKGFRGIIATRVLAISPFTEIVSRHDARIPFEDRTARWLE